MNAKTPGYGSLARAVPLVAALFCMAAQHAVAADQASGWGDLVSDPLLDPLRSRPAMLGETAPVSGGWHVQSCRAPRNWQYALTLSEAVDFALCNNPQIKAAWAAIKIDAAGVGEAKAAYLPSLSVNTNRLNTRTTYSESLLTPSSVSGDTVSASVSWRLFDFGGRESNRLAANHLLLSAMASHDAALQKTLVATIQAYFDTQSASAVLQAKDETRRLAQGTLDSAARREGIGTAPHGDVLQASTALAKAMLDQSRAEGSYRKALSVLAYTIGASADTAIQMPQEDGAYGTSSADSAPLDDLSADLQAWLQAAASHPEIRATRAQWQSAVDKITAVRGEGLPTVDFNANFYKNGYPGQGISTVGSKINTVGISVSFPLFDGFAHTYKVRQAQAQAEQLEAQLADVEHSVAMEVVKVYADSVASLRNLQSSHNLLSAAREGLASAQRRYGKGVADIVEMLNAENAFADARQEQIVSIAEWRSARLRLLASTGMLERSSIEVVK